MAMTRTEEFSDDTLEEVASHMLTVSTFATDEVVTIDAGATVAEAATAMAAAELGLLVVGTVDDVDGVVSERDIVRAVASGRDPDTFPIRELETTKLIWCDESASVADVAEQMLEHYVRHVLVEDDGRLVGIVSARDILGAYAAGA